MTYQFRTILKRAVVRVFTATAQDGVIHETAKAHDALLARIVIERLNEPTVRDLEALKPLLHDNIIAILSNPLIEKSSKRMHNYLRLVRRNRRLTAPLASQSVREHLDIIRACKARDPDSAELVLQTRFNAAPRRHLGLLTRTSH